MTTLCISRPHQWGLAGWTVTSRDSSTCPSLVESLHSILSTTTSPLLPPLLTYLSVPSSYLKDLRGGNDFLGKTFVGLNDLPLKGEESWFDLQSHRGRPRGRVQIKLHIDIKMVRWPFCVVCCAFLGIMSLVPPPCRRAWPMIWLWSTTRSCLRHSAPLSLDGPRHRPLLTWPVWKHR